MKKIVFLLFLIPVFLQAQSTFTAPVGYNTGAPSGVPSGTGTRIRFDLLTNKIYTWSPTGLNWQLQGQTIDQISGTSAPAYTPIQGQSTFAVNGDNPPKLYQYSGSGTVWICLNCATGATYTAGTGIAISGANVISNTGDLSATNEIQYIDTLSVSGGNLNISLSLDGLPAKTISVTNIAPDQSPTNELQNLSLSGQSLGISSGTGVTLPVVGVVGGTGISVASTGGNVTVTNAGDLSPTNELNTSLNVSGGSLRITDAGGTLTTPVTGIAPVQSVFGGTGITVSGTSSLTVTNTGDLSNTNELQTLSLSGSNLSLSNGGGTVTLPGGADGNGIYSGSGSLQMGDTTVVSIPSASAIIFQPNDTTSTLYVDNTNIKLQADGYIMFGNDFPFKPNSYVITPSVPSGASNLNGGGLTFQLGDGSYDASPGTGYGGTFQASAGQGKIGGGFVLYGGQGSQEGGRFDLSAGNGDVGGGFTLTGGQGFNGAGGTFTLLAGGSDNGPGGQMQFNGGYGTDAIGGNITFIPGVGTPNGAVRIKDASNSVFAYLLTDSLSIHSPNLNFPNIDEGTFTTTSTNSSYLSSAPTSIGQIITDNKKVYYSVGHGVNDWIRLTDKSGYTTGTTDGSGYFTITHGFGTTPTTVVATYQGNRPIFLTVVDGFTNSTTFKVRAWNALDGGWDNGVSIGVNWIAK